MFEGGVWYIFNYKFSENRLELSIKPAFLCVSIQPRATEENMHTFICDTVCVVIACMSQPREYSYGSVYASIFSQL